LAIILSPGIIGEGSLTSRLRRLSSLTLTNLTKFKAGAGSGAPLNKVPGSSTSLSVLMGVTDEVGDADDVGDCSDVGEVGDFRELSMK